MQLNPLSFPSNDLAATTQFFERQLGMACGPGHDRSSGP
jgi:hypothetical protein